MLALKKPLTLNRSNKLYFNLLLIYLNKHTFAVAAA